MDQATAFRIYRSLVKEARNRLHMALRYEKYSTFWWVGRYEARAYMDAAREVGAACGACDLLKARVRNFRPEMKEAA